MWHYLLCCHYVMCCLVFLPWNCRHYIFKHPYLTHMKSNFGSFLCSEFSTSFSLHILFGFPLEEIFFLLDFENILWNNKFLKVPCNNLKIKSNQDDLCFLWDLGPKILTNMTFPYLYFGILLACPPNFFWISKHWQQSRHSTWKKKTLLQLF
jgi:hypothetical protein